MTDLQKKNGFRINCIICQKEFRTTPSQVKWRKRKTCSKDCRSLLLVKRGADRRAEGGYTKHQLDRIARYSKAADDWRKAVFERDDYTCQFCRVRGGYLEADHIKPFAYFPELRYKLYNGRTLCGPCHNKTKMSASKMKIIWNQ